MKSLVLALAALLAPTLARAVGPATPQAINQYWQNSAHNPGAGGGGGSCGGAISVIQSTGHHANGTSVAIPFNSAVVAGRTIVVGIAEYDTNVANITVQDNKGNTYTRIRDKTTCSSKMSIWQSANIATGGSNFIVTVQGDNTVRTFGAIEVEGTACLGTLDTNTSNNGTSENWSTGQITTTQRDLIVAMANHDAGLTFGIAAGGGWTQGMEDENNVDRLAFSMIYRVGDAGNYTGTWTADESAAYCAMIESFK